MHVGLTRFSGSTNVARNHLSGKDCSQVRQVSNSSPIPSCPASPQPLYSRRPPEGGGPSSPDAHSSSSKHAQVHIGQNDDAAAAPQPQPGELEPSKVCCATLAFALAARHLDQRREQFRFTGCRDDKAGVPNLNCVHPTRVCSQVVALPCQPHHMLLEIQESCCVEDAGLSGSRDVDPRKLTQHTRSPLAVHQVTPGIISVKKGHPFLDPERKAIIMCYSGSTQT